MHLTEISRTKIDLNGVKILFLKILSITQRERAKKISS